ncbi:hypothetical protein F9K33_06960 [bacterium]|nr:MAG: hypothetical protein F9K33_06960 [bacterium]
MIDTKHILTVGVDDDTKAIYDEYIDNLNQKISISPANAKTAFKGLMNILISLEENKNIRKGYDSLPSFFITHRMLYMKLFDFLTENKFSPEDIDNFLFNDQPLALPSNEEFLTFCNDAISRVFETLQPFLDADDDADRFNRVIALYTQFLKTQNDVGAMVTLIHQFSGFADKIYMAGYKKTNDGWGGKLDLDNEVYPVFFEQIIREEVEPYKYSEYVVHFLYDRLKEVGEAETVLPDLYEFSKSLASGAQLRDEIKAADEMLATEISKTIQLVQEQKGEALSAFAQSAIVKELTAYEKLEGIIYFYFDDRRLHKAMKDTNTADLYESALRIMKDYSPKIKHFVMYALGKLLLAPKSKVKMDESSLKMFCKETKMCLETINSDAVMNNLPAQYRQRVPDLEVRFLMNRMMTSTVTLERFEELQDQFRQYLTNQQDFPLIHEMYIERAAEKRHASALMSFYILAWLAHDIGDVFPDPLIKVLAGRLSLTYSFTRRINLFFEIKKLRYEFDGTHGDRETLYYNGFDKQHVEIPEKEKHTPLKDRPFDEQWIMLYHFINNKELQQALRLIDEQVLFDYIYSNPKHTAEELEEARMELRGKVYKILDDKFLDLISNEEEHDKRVAESRGEFPAAYYGKYEKVRSLLIAQFLASTWDVEVYELKRKGKKPLIRMTQTELLRSIKNIDVKRVLEQYEYKEARENIDVNTLSKQAEAREQLLGFINGSVKEEARTVQKLNGLSDEAIALLSYSSTKLRSNELKVELGVKQLVERLKADLGLQASREPLALSTILNNAFAGQYGKIDIKVIKKDKSGKPLIDQETGEEAEKTYTITPEKFPDYLIPAREEIERMDKKQLYRTFYSFTLQSIISETFTSLTFIREALAKNKYVVAADGLKEQALENHEILEYARIKMEMANQLAPYEIPQNVA